MMHIPKVPQVVISWTSPFTTFLRLRRPNFLTRLPVSRVSLPRGMPSLCYSTEAGSRIQISGSRLRILLRATFCFFDRVLLFVDLHLFQYYPGWSKSEGRKNSRRRGHSRALHYCYFLLRNRAAFGKSFLICLLTRRAMRTVFFASSREIGS